MPEGTPATPATQALKPAYTSTLRVKVRVDSGYMPEGTRATPATQALKPSYTST